MTDELDHDDDLPVTLPADATPDEIKAAFRKRANETHPDKNPSPHATEQMARLSRARSEALGEENSHGA